MIKKRILLLMLILLVAVPACSAKSDNTAEMTAAEKAALLKINGKGAKLGV